MSPSPARTRALRSGERRSPRRGKPVPRVDPSSPEPRAPGSTQRYSLPLLAAVVAAPLAVVAAQAPIQPSFRTGIDVVSLNVTVAEGQHFVTNLEQADFNVYEDGVQQNITFFNKTNLPIALAVLLDTSASMDTK